MRKRRLALVCTLITLGAGVACDQIFGINEGNLVDGSVIPDGGGNDVQNGDTGADASTAVTGIQAHYYVMDNPATVTKVNVDLSAGVTAYVFNADGGVDPYVGTGTGKGTFSIDGIPPGAVYYMKVGSLSNASQTFQGPVVYKNPFDVYVFSDLRTLDFSEYVGGRTNVVVLDAGADAAANTQVGELDYTFTNVNSTEQVQNGGAIAVYSINSGFSGSPGAAADPISFQPTSDASSDGSTYWGADPLYTWLPVTSAGSDLTYVTVSDYVDGGLDPNNPAVAITQAAAAPVQVNIPGSISAAMKTLDASTLSFTWDHGAFISNVGQLSSANAVSFQQMGLGAQPYLEGGVTYAGQTGGLLNYGLFGTYATTSTQEAVQLPYGDPFPSTWQRLLSVSLIAKVSSQVTFAPDAGPDGGDGGQAFTFNGNAFMQCQFDLATVAGKTVGPLITPVQNIQINGHTGFNDQKQTGVLQPTISWDPPLTGTATGYYISLREIVYSPTPPHTRNHVVTFLFMTPNVRQITVPPGLLASGHNYEFSIVAISSSSPPNAPLLSAVPYCNANTVSGIYMP